MTFTARMYSNLGNRIGIEPSSWRDDAACKDTDPSIFFPDIGISPLSLLPKAREYCDRCPVKSDCLQEGRRAEYGIWGGRVFGLKGNVFECENCGAQERHQSEQPRRWCSDRCRMQARRTA